MKVKVFDIVKVIGRGTVLIFEKDFGFMCGDTITTNNETFEIVGIEKLQQITKIGLILHPNNKVEKLINVDDIVLWFNK